MGEDSSSLQLLWVVPKYPLPADDGARHATVVLLKDVVQQGAEVDLVVLDPDPSRRDVSELQEALGVRNVFLVPRPDSSGSKLSRFIRGLPEMFTRKFLPLTIQPYATEQIHAAFLALIEGRLLELKKHRVTGSFENFSPGWDGVLFDGLHTSGFLFDGKRCTPPDGFPPIFYRAHNVESDLWRAKTSRCRYDWEQYLYRWQENLVYEYEVALLRKVKRAFPVSGHDENRLKEILPRLQTKEIPIGYEFPDSLKKRDPERGQFLFVGRLDWPPNREGLEWFLQEVWPEAIERRSDLVLRVVGKGNGAYLKRYSSLRGIKLVGYVEDLEEEYLSAQATIVPIKYGSGTRVKVVEASRYGCPVISSEIGARGLPLLSDHSFFESENLTDWITRLTNTSQQAFETVGNAAFSELKEHCDPKKVAEAFISEVQAALKGGSSP